MLIDHFEHIIKLLKKSRWSICNSSHNFENRTIFCSWRFLDIINIRLPFYFQIYFLWLFLSLGVGMVVEVKSISFFVKKNKQPRTWNEDCHCMSQNNVFDPSYMIHHNPSFRGFECMSWIHNTLRTMVALNLWLSFYSWRGVHICATQEHSL